MSASEIGGGSLGKAVLTAPGTNDRINVGAPGASGGGLMRRPAARYALVSH
jgi:hypothetical protein